MMKCWREWGPLTAVGTHMHSFAAKGLVRRGEMWLMVGDITQHITAGGAFELAPGIAHSERYGADGATYWVGRKLQPYRL